MKRVSLLALAAALLVSTLSGCGQSNPGSASGDSTGTSTTDNVFRTYTTSNVANFCPYCTASVPMDYVQGKLYRYMPNETGDGTVIVPDLAASEPTSEDNITWIIPIDPEAKWSNGEPINADTFMYSWQKALDPVMLHTTAGSLAKNIIEVKNAQAYYTQASTGVAVDWEDVGFKKVDDYTLSVTFADEVTATQVMQHFQQRMTSPVYQAIYDECASEDGTTSTYGTEVQYYMSSGPFALTEYIKDNTVEMEKNPYYVHEDEVTLDKLEIRVIADENTRMQMFESGQLDYLSLGSNGVVKYGDDPSVIEYQSSSIREIEINFDNPDKPFLNNINFRKALFYGIDRETIASLTYSAPAAMCLANDYTCSSDGTPIHSLPEAQAYLPENNGYDPELAVEYFEKALQETGMSRFDVELVYNSSADATRVASEYLQSSLTKLFGEDRFSINLTAMTYNDTQTLMKTCLNGPTSEWDLCWAGWDLSAAVLSPNMKFQVYTSTSPRRLAPYHDDKLDELFELSTTTEYRMDEEKMTQICMEMEQAWLDNVDAIPVFNEVARFMFSDRVDLVSKTNLRIIGFAIPYISVH